MNEIMPILLPVALGLCGLMAGWFPCVDKNTGRMRGVGLLFVVLIVGLTLALSAMSVQAQRAYDNKLRQLHEAVVDRMRLATESEQVISPFLGFVILATEEKGAIAQKSITRSYEPRNGDWLDAAKKKIAELKRGISELGSESDDRVVLAGRIEAWETEVEGMERKWDRTSKLPVSIETELVLLQHLAHVGRRIRSEILVVAEQEFWGKIREIEMDQVEAKPTFNAGNYLVVALVVSLVANLLLVFRDRAKTTCLPGAGR